MYIMNCIRLDIAYSVSKLSRYTSNPGEDHWKALVRVLRYLKDTLNYGLHYTWYPIILEGYRIVILIGYPTQKTPYPRVDMSLHLVVQQYLGNLLNKHALLDPQWN